MVQASTTTNATMTIMTNDNNNETQHTVQKHGMRRIMHRLWLPSLLFGDGLLLSVIVMVLMMLHRFGLNNAQAAMFTALLGFPFALRPVLEMAVTYFRGTTKVWILSAEFISALSLWALAFILPTGYWLQGITCFIPFFVLAGVFGNIAMERFYIADVSHSTHIEKIVAASFRGIGVLFGIGIAAMLAGNMEVLTRNVRYSWSFMFYVLAGIEFFLWLWHTIFLPGGRHGYAGRKDLFGLRTTEYNEVLNDIMHDLRNRFMLYFFVFFAIPEALMAAIAPLFIVDAPHNGGLGLSPQEFGLLFGTVGIIAVFAGKALGSNAISRYGLRRLMLPLAFVQAVHALTLLYLSYHLAATFATVALFIFLGNMALGLALAAYDAVVTGFATANGAVLRRSIALALLALTVIIGVMFSGMLQMDIGYRQFFIIGSGANAASLFAATAYVLTRTGKQPAIEEQENNNAN